MVINQFNVTGNMGADPEMSYTQGGKAITKLRIAVWQGQDKPTMWIRVNCWDQLGEKVNEKLHKGEEVYVSGRLTMSEYTDKGGVQRQSWEITASTVQQTQKSARTGSSPAYAGTTRASRYGDNNDDLGDLGDHPF